MYDVKTYIVIAMNFYQIIKQKAFRLVKMRHFSTN